MIDFITHYYDQRTSPFRSLSWLADEEALALMRSLYTEDSEYGKRFKDPERYLKNRKATERWVRDRFTRKGGRPKENNPVYAVLGESRWIEENAPIDGNTAKIRLPLSLFRDEDLSFTYPDSMISKWFGDDKPKDLYMEEYHGKVFLASEIVEIVRALGIPEYCWKTNLPGNLAPYIECQIWNLDAVKDFSPNGNVVL